MDIADKKRATRTPSHSVDQNGTLPFVSRIYTQCHSVYNYKEYQSELDKSKAEVALLREQLKLQHDNLKRLQADTKELSYDKYTFDQMFANSPIGCLLIDRLQNIIKINSAAQRLLGPGPLNKALLPLLIEPEFRKALAERIEHASRGSGGKLPVRLMSPGKAVTDTEVTEVLLHVEPLRDHRCKKVVCHIAIEEIEEYHAIEDELRKARDYLQQLATHDELTSLPNRRKFNKGLSSALTNAQSNNAVLAMVLIDLNGFKQVNDTHGHECGDLLLIETAKRLERSVEHYGDAVVARLGGDEFAVIISDESQTQESEPYEFIEQACQYIKSGLEEPYSIGNQLIQSTASIGVSLFPADTNNPDKLIQFADAAMYRAKQAPGSKRSGCSICFFDGNMKRQLKRRKELERDIRAANSSKDLTVLYQPIVAVTPNANKLRTVELEALVRWNHLSHGHVHPEEFLGIAQDCGTIRKLGFTVIEQSLATLASMHRQGHKDLVVSINITAAQFTDRDFSTRLVSALYANNLRPRHLMLEVTENELLDGCQNSTQCLSNITDAGIGLSIDDFGTGYSSFSHLRQLRISRIKIARSFVRKVPFDSDDCSIVTAIVSIARDLEIDVGAIGVENVRQLEFLSTAGCSTIQGYLLSKPVASSELTHCLQKIKAMNISEKTTAALRKNTH